MKQYHLGAAARLFEQVIKMACQLGAIVLLARFMPQDDLGVVLLAQTLVTLLLFLNQLGLDSIFVKTIVSKEALPVSRYFSSCFFARLLSALVCIIVINTLAFFLFDKKYALVFFLFSLSHLFMPFSTYNWYFEATVQSVKTSISIIAGSLVSFIVKVFFAYHQYPIEFIVLGYVADYIVIALLNFLLLKEDGLLARKNISFETMQKALKKSYPLIFSGALSLVYMKVDQLMLGNMLGEAEVAQYVVATRLSEAWIFVGFTLVGVYYPLIMKEKLVSSLRYKNSIINKAKWLIWCSLLLAVVTCFIADLLILFLYGDNYLKSANVLAISIWTVPFTYLGTIASRMYINEGQQGLLFWRSLIGVVINIIGNAVLIPGYGVVGASIATVVSQFVVGVVFNIFGKNNFIFLVQLRLILGCEYKKV